MSIAPIEPDAPPQRLTHSQIARNIGAQHHVHHLAVPYLRGPRHRFLSRRYPP